MLARSARLYYKYYHSKDTGAAMQVITMKASDADEPRPAPGAVAEAPRGVLDEPNRAGPTASRGRPNRYSLV
jgi:hypothetical protein